MIAALALKLDLSMKGESNGSCVLPADDGAFSCYGRTTPPGFLRTALLVPFLRDEERRENFVSRKKNFTQGIV